MKKFFLRKTCSIETTNEITTYKPRLVAAMIIDGFQRKCNIEKIIKKIMNKDGTRWRILTAPLCEPIMKALQYAL
jgi:hypothetical protein